MGTAIAQVSASYGHPVLLFDTVPEAAAEAVERMRSGLARRVAQAGPLEWLDALGPERVLSTLDNLHDAYRDPRYRATPGLRRRVERHAPQQDRSVP